MAAHFTTLGLIRRVMVIAILFPALPPPSFAYSAEARQMCTGDAFRLCSSEIPNIPRITAWMIKQRTNLSVGCRAVLDRSVAEQFNKAAASPR